MNINPTDFWTAANAITALVVGLVAVAVTIFLHRRSRRKELTIISEKPKLVFSEVLVAGPQVKLKIADIEVTRLFSQRIQIGNTASNAVSDVSVSIQRPGADSFFGVNHDEDGVRPTRIEYDLDGDTEGVELYFDFLNPKEVCSLNLYFDGEPSECIVVHRQPDVITKFVRQSSAYELLETSFGITATYASGGATAAILGALVRFLSK